MTSAPLSPLEVARALRGRVVGKNKVRAPSPGMPPTDDSLEIKFGSQYADGFTVNDYYGGGDDWKHLKDSIREACGKPWGPSQQKDDPVQRMNARAKDFNNAAQQSPDKASKREHGDGRLPDENIVETYNYTDADGALLYQVVRYDPKDFRQRKPDGKGGWIWKSHARYVPYRWPDLVNPDFPDATVFVTEGEKDADRLASLNQTATTVDGRGKWSDEAVVALKGRHLFVLEDNDDKGRQRATKAANALHGHAASIRYVRLPNIPEGGDASDWLDANNNNVDALVDICLAAPEYVPPQPEENTSSSSAEDDFTNADKSSQKPPPLKWLNMSNWDSESIPQRQWAIRDRVPLKQAGLFSGEGGTGKSIIELMKNVAHVMGKDWLGSLPEPGPAFYLGAEDDEDEIHIRLAAIAEHYGTTFKDLIDGGLRVLPLLGQDATLCAVTQGGKVEVTGLYNQLFEAAGDIKPKNISIDTLSRAFSGNEIDRVQVYGFAMHMQALAKVAGGSITVLSHPSLAGISSGSGISGSTAWHGAFRFRQYLKSSKSDGGEQPDNDLRELDFKKNQYGPLGESIVLRYQRGLFLPEGGISSLEKLAREAEADAMFLDLLRRFAGQGRNLSEKIAANNYAPAAFADEPDAKKKGIRKADFKGAMSRLFSASKIHVENYGRPSRPATRLAVKA